MVKPTSASKSLDVIASTPRAIARFLRRSSLVTRGALLILSGGSNQSVASVIDVPGSEFFEGLPITSETSPAKAPVAQDGRTGWDLTTQIKESRQEQRPAVLVGSGAEFVDGDVREQHLKLPLADRRPYGLVSPWHVDEGVNRVGIHDDASHSVELSRHVARQAPSRHPD